MRRGDGPVFVQQCRTALVQVGGRSPLTQRYLPGPPAERCLRAADDTRLGEHPFAAHCKMNDKNSLHTINTFK